jgi:hypothetical protein
MSDWRPHRAALPAGVQEQGDGAVADIGADEADAIHGVQLNLGHGEMTAAYVLDHSRSGDRAAALSDYTLHFAR